MLPTLTIRPICEADIDEIIQEAGGTRAHENAHKRTKKGADYRLDDTVIELKILEEDGLSKPERQAKLASLFLRVTPDRPVIVLDRKKLPEPLRRDYNRILEGPVKTAISKARTQLSQSRMELKGTNTSVLMIVNNGYTALRHEELLALATHRARQDTTEIDGIVVGGCYYYTDGFDSFYLWPLEYIPINVSKTFDFKSLQVAWNNFSERFMTRLLQVPPGRDSTRGPVIDQTFNVGSTTFVMPTPQMGTPSSFYYRGRPRQNSSGIDTCPSVAIVRAEISAEDWPDFQGALDELAGMTLHQWNKKLAENSKKESILQPSVTMRVKFRDWLAWHENRSESHCVQSVHVLATEFFEKAVRDTMGRAIEWSGGRVLPARYVLLISEEIGQDKANDISRIAVAKSNIDNDQPMVLPLVSDARIFFEHALALASAYAVREHLDYVVWNKNLEYGWY